MASARSALRWVKRSRTHEDWREFGKPGGFQETTRKVRRRTQQVSLAVFRSEKVWRCEEAGIFQWVQLPTGSPGFVTGCVPTSKHVIASGFGTTRQFDCTECSGSTDKRGR